MKHRKKELKDEEIVNLSDAELKTLVIRVLTEMTEYGCKIEEEVKATQSEIKKNVQETKSQRKETKTQINNLEQKEEINIPLEQIEGIRIQKNEERLRNFWDNLKCSNLQIIGVPQEEEEEQEIENLFEKIMKNFPNLAKEIDFQEVPEVQSPKEVGSKKHTKTHHNYITQDER